MTSRETFRVWCWHAFNSGHHANGYSRQAQNLHRYMMNVWLKCAGVFCLYIFGIICATHYPLQIPPKTQAPRARKMLHCSFCASRGKHTSFTSSNCLCQKNGNEWKHGGEHRHTEDRTVHKGFPYVGWNCWEIKFFFKVMNTHVVRFAVCPQVRVNLFLLSPPINKQSAFKALC